MYFDNLTIGMLILLVVFAGLGLIVEYFEQRNGR